MKILTLAKHPSQEKSNNFQFIPIQRRLSKYGDIRNSKNPIKLLYFICSEYLKFGVMDTSRSGLASWAGVSVRTIDLWLTKLYDFDLIDYESYNRGVLLSMTSFGDEFIAFLRDDRPLLITTVEESVPYVQTAHQTAHQESTTLYTDHNHEILKNHIKADTPVDNQEDQPVADTNIIEAKITEINQSLDKPISKEQTKSMKDRLRRYQISSGQFKYACEAYEHMSKEIEIQSVTGFLIDQCKKISDQQAHYTPNQTNLLTKDLCKKLNKIHNFGYTTRYQMEETFTAIRDALLAVQHH